MQQCMLGESKVSIHKDVKKGVCLRASVNVKAGDVLLREVPLLSTPTASEKLKKSIDEFCRIIEGEDRLLILLSRRYIPPLCAFADAPAQLREAVLSLQSDFAVSDSKIAKAARRLAIMFHRSGLFSTSGGLVKVSVSKEHISLVLNLLIINSADTLPDGSEAVFYMGAMLEHSCSPNARFCIRSWEQDAAPAKQLWIGEWQATKNIASGEPVTTSYLEPELLERPARERGHVLLARMGFNCACDSCSQELRSAAALQAAQH
ncbi:unnamed protein product [Cladocopium goreaui]|uniref:SET domain-containing protein n=1 Tax=Cladocopium goreaui TaxID=2562237 RepID=A0A9P1BPJ8_9DINO|nr:unnamed protein product [Cladocopium goreaui]